MRAFDDMLLLFHVMVRLDRNSMSVRACACLLMCFLTICDSETRAFLGALSSQSTCSSLLQCFSSVSKSGFAMLHAVLLLTDSPVIQT